MPNYLDLLYVDKATRVIPAMPVTILELKDVESLYVTSQSLPTPCYVEWAGWGLFDPSKSQMSYLSSRALDPGLKRGKHGYRYRRAYPDDTEASSACRYYDLLPGGSSPMPYLMAQFESCPDDTAVVECDPVAAFGNGGSLFDWCQAVSLGNGALKLLALNGQQDRFQTSDSLVHIDDIALVGDDLVFMTYTTETGPSVELLFSLSSAGPVPTKLEIVDDRLRVEIDVSQTDKSQRYYWHVVQHVGLGTQRVIGGEDLVGRFVPYTIAGELEPGW